MAFIVEDGSVVENANSLVSVEFADGYHNERQNKSWKDETLTSKQAKLIVATEFFVGRYGRRLPGIEKTNTQSFHFPATNACYRNGRKIADNVVPVEVKKSISELALVLIDSKLVVNRPANNSTSTVRESTRILGPLTTKTVYETSISGFTISRASFPVAAQFLTNLLTGSSNGGVIVN